MENFLQVIKNFGPARLAAMGGLALFLLIFMFVMIIRSSSSTDQVLLFGGLAPQDANKIVQRLEQNNTPYTLAKEGTEILVPAAQVSALRVELAELSMPLGKLDGYELFDKADVLSSTSFGQQVNLVRALEGELSRTIMAVEGIQGARVHLVMPRREIFSKEPQKPTASVIVMLKKGSTLSAAQVEAVQRLVSAAIPKLLAKDVAIIDNAGMLLSKDYSNEAQMTLNTNEEYRRSYETKLTNAVQTLLERTVGLGKVRAEITVEMDFSQVVSNRELYNPEQQVARSTTTREERIQSDEREEPVTVEQNLPDSETQSGIYNRMNTSRTEETTNYEISKEVINQVRENGVVKRISAAVMVDGTYTASEDGKKTYVPRSENEMEVLASLVRSAIGYDANRGDQIEVVNLRFVNYLEDEDGRPLDPVILLGFTKSEVFKIAEGLGIIIVTILIILLVLRPLITRAFETPEPAEEEDDISMLLSAPQQDPNAQLLENQMKGGASMIPGAAAAMQDDDDSNLKELIDIAKVEGRVKASSIRKIGEIIDKHPEESINIIRVWLYKEPQ